MMDPVLFSTWGAALVALLTAGVFLARYGATPPALLLAVGFVVLAMESMLIGASALALLPEHMLVWQRARLAVAGLLPGCWLAFSLVYARTNYREFLRLWRIPLVAACLLPLILVTAGWHHLAVAVHLDEGRLYWTQQLGVAGFALRVVEIVITMLILMNAEKTLREAHGVTRWRVKFMLAGVSLIFAARIIISGQTLWRQWINPVYDALGALALMAGCALLMLSLRRSPRLQVDLYVSTDMVFGSITVVLVAVYLLAVGLLARITTHGMSETLQLAVGMGATAALVLLILLLLSDHMRVEARRFLVRHLRRPTFDYRQLWRAFSERTLHAMNAVEVTREVCRLVSETFEALSVSLWLLDEQRNLRLAASTALEGGSVPPKVPDTVPKELVNQWRKTDVPMDLDRASGTWVKWMCESNPIQFPEGGHRFCMPLIAADDVLGLMIVGDRVRGFPFTAEELDLLRVLADQAAARLLAVRMGERMMDANQMKAFQLMSAFLIHDFKNTAYGLTLTLQNLRTYFNDPAFRKDAERIMAAGVEKMNEVIRRMGGLQKNLELKPRGVQFNDWLEALLQSLEGVSTGGVRWNPGPPAQIRLDPDQMQSVLTNLVMNAREASPPDCPVEVSTGRSNGWVVLSVKDTGCGMTPEFVASRLFQPFETTKKSGMGIGLYQSRMVVEAHGGRIEVESAPEKGSTFRVLLPLEKTL